VFTEAGVTLGSANERSVAMAQCEQLLFLRAAVAATSGPVSHDSVITGGGALLSDIDKLISEETGLPVIIADDPPNQVFLDEENLEGTNVRPVADGLRDRFVDVRLASKESVPRSPRSEDSLREGVADRFTDRQWAALSAAYHGGYFDWPRGSTAEEVADAMDVSSPTFHNHLRKAQRALLDGLFERERREGS
jgi:hypothetical protein